MTATLEPPSLTQPAVTHHRPGESTLVLRLRGNLSPIMPALNLMGTNLLRTALKNELDAEGVPFSYLKAAGPLNVALVMLSTSDTPRALRCLKTVLAAHVLDNFATIHAVNRETRLLVRLHPAPAGSDRAPAAASLDDLLVELSSIARFQTYMMTNVIYPNGRVADFVDDAVTHAENPGSQPESGELRAINVGNGASGRLSLRIPVEALQDFIKRRESLPAPGAGRVPTLPIKR